MRIVDSRILEQQTVLVLGAASNLRYGFPLGVQLRDAILGTWGPRSLKNLFASISNAPLVSGLAEHGVDDTLFREFLEKLQWRKTIFSVDRFLEQPEHEEFESAGLAAITLAITECLANANYHLPTAENDLYKQILGLIETSHPDDFLNHRLRVITFNYDTSLEYYLARALSVRWGMSPARAWNEFINPTIQPLHMYGTVIYHNAIFTDEGGTMFGRPVEVMRASRENKEVLSTAASYLKDAERVAFLGFGYDALNLSRLGFSDKDVPFKKRSGTRVLAGSTVGNPDVKCISMHFPDHHDTLDSMGGRAFKERYPNGRCFLNKGTRLEEVLPWLFFDDKTIWP